MPATGWNIAYFRDDHKRILRVAIHGETWEIKLHVLRTVENEKVWVPFPSVDPIAERLRISAEIESLSYEELVEQASNCPLFKKD